MSLTYNQIYYLKNKEREKVRTKKYRQQNPDKAKKWETDKYEKHKDKIRLRSKLRSRETYEKRKSYQKAYREKHKESNQLYSSNYRRLNGASLKLKKEEYRKRNKIKINQNNKKWVNSSVLNRITQNLRTSISRRLRRSVNGKIRHLDYSINELMAHLESKFQPGMSWDNYGRKGWHVDHITPLRFKNNDNTYFWNQEELSDPTSNIFKQAWGLINLQPLWEYDNFKKNSYRRT